MATLPTFPRSPQSVAGAPDTWAAHGLDRAARAALQVKADALCARLRLPLRTVSGGRAGQWLGRGIGSSLEFQDHRPYLPGDDPRYLNWAAYARTGHYTMKMYREEVSPQLDLALDCSPSMFLTAAKARRVLELLAFAAGCAERAGAALRVYQMNPETANFIPPDALRSHQWEPLPAVGRVGGPVLNRVPWRRQSLRVIITDLLYAVPPEMVLGPLLLQPGRVILFCPWSGAEFNPDWTDQVELRECESGELRLLQASPTVLSRYLANYRRHFSLWEEACRGRGIALARLGDEGDLLEVLVRAALPAGAVELCN